MSEKEWERRLEVLERAHRSHRRFSGALVLSIAVALGLAAGGGQESGMHVEPVPVLDSLRARRIDIVAADGRVTCTLMTELDGSGEGAGLLVLRNRAGTSVCRLGSLQDNGALSLHMASGLVASAVGAFGDGGTVELFGPEECVAGRLRAEGGVGKLLLEGDARVELVKEPDGARCVLGFEEGGGTLALHKDSDVGVVLASDAQGQFQSRPASDK